MDEREQGEPPERRRSDRRVGDRRLVARSTPDRRQGDRRRAGVVLFTVLSFGRLEPRAEADPAAGPVLAFSRDSLSAGSPPALDGMRTRRRGPAAFRTFIDESAEKHGVSAALVEAVIRVESQFNPRAVSHKGAQGLMQLMPDTARRFGVKDSFDPQQNIAGGTRYLAWLLREFSGDIDLACAAYNAGEKVVVRYGGIPPYRETRDYVRKINRILGRATSAAPPAPRRESIFYTWRDDRGILNVSQYPPRAGQKYQTHRLR